jgi:hypothetical protein
MSSTTKGSASSSERVQRRKTPAKKEQRGGFGWVVVVSALVVAGAAVKTKFPLGQVLQTAGKNVWSRISGSSATMSVSAPRFPPKIMVFMNGEHTGGAEVSAAVLNDFDGPDLGALLSPLQNCVPVVPLPVLPKETPCKVFDHLGRRVLTVGDMSPEDEVEGGDDVTRLYLVPPDRSFVWPTVEIGRKVTVPHVFAPGGRMVTLETLSHSPRVFLLENFFSPEEADGIVADTLAETDEDHRLKRSSTGTTGKDISRSRTSDNAFLTHTDLAVTLKKRIFRLLGIEPYEDTWADGLQVLRYNISQAYIPHLDYLEAVEGEHDFESGVLGSNRFATVVLYLSDVEEGGQTVFTRTDDGSEEEDEQSLAEMRTSQSDYLSSIGIEKGSWEEKLLAQCRVRLATQPRKGSAVMFYSQHPDGELDMKSYHGACPVTRGIKWAANLWVWNGPRYGLSKKDEYGRMQPQDASASHVSLTAVNVDVPGASLYFGTDRVWEAEWSVEDEIKINTYVSHQWVAKVGDQIVRRWTISSSVPPEQNIELRAHDLQPE